MGIAKIEKIGRENCQCIKVDALDNLYVTDDFILTHNTTLARILAKKLNCLPPRDLVEINAADFNGIDTVREIRRAASSGSIMGREYSRCWIIDEGQQLSTAAQQGLLKLLEEAPAYAYFFLCTTDPQKIIPTIKNRCSEIKINSVSVVNLVALCNSVLAKEGMDIGENVLEQLAVIADGSPRKCLVKLEQLIELPTDSARLKALEKDESFNVAIKDLGGIFTKQSKKDWKDVAKIVKALCEENEPETIRYAILGWLNSALLGGWARGIPNAVLADIMLYWDQDFYTSKAAGVTLAAYKSWELISTGK